MTGTQLLEALSFVDETYIQEAETAQLGRNTPWMKILSVAACLCILITGVYAYSQMQSKGVMESMAEPEAAAPAAPAESPAEAAPREESVREEAAPEPPMAVEAEIPSGELQHIPYAVLILHSCDGALEAIVESVSEDSTPLEAGMQLKLVIDPVIVPGGREEPYENGYAIPAQEELRVEIENGAYNAEENILYVEELIY